MNEATPKPSVIADRETALDKQFRDRIDQFLLVANEDEQLTIAALAILNIKPEELRAQRFALYSASTSKNVDAVSGLLHTLPTEGQRWDVAKRIVEALFAVEEEAK